MYARNEKLKCSWGKWEVSGEKSLTLYLPENDVSDMEGTIEIAKILMPNVKIITVVSVFRNDYTVYKRGGLTWTSSTEHVS